MVEFSSTPNVIYGSAVYAYLQKPAATSFRSAMTSPGRTMTMNSAFRSLAQQLLLYQWYILKRCSIGLAAKPGTSNHESGLAFDVNDGSSWNSHMSKYSFKWYGSGDPPHFDYVGSGIIEIRPSSTKGKPSSLSFFFFSLSLSLTHTHTNHPAFQKLWNKNNPNDKITEDGIYGPNTEARLLKSPVDGFPITTGC